MSENTQAPRSAAEIENELRDVRARLADNLEALIGEVHPAAVVNRTVDKAKDAVGDAKAKVEDVLSEAKSKASEAISAVKAKAEDRFGGWEAFDEDSEEEDCDAPWCLIKESFVGKDGKLTPEGKKSAAICGGALAAAVGVWVFLRRRR